MKKMYLKIIMALSLLAISVGCKTEVLELNQGTEKSCNSEIACNIQKMKNEGLLDQLILQGRSVNATEEDKQIERFINDTDAVLNEIKNEEDGEIKIDMLNTLFCEGSIEDFSTSFEKINPEKAKEFTEFISKKNNLQENNYRSAINKKITNFSYYYGEKSRGAYAANFDWDTIAWYSGFCAATVAGFYLASYGGFWTRIAGVVAAGAGAASMGVQLTKWVSCNDFYTFCSSLINKDASTVTAKMNEGLGAKYVVIAAETITTLALCYTTPVGSAIVGFLKNIANTLIGKVLEVIPSWLTISVQGIPLKLL